MTKLKKNSGRFEVSLDQRLKQQKDACDAYRMPRLGYVKYLVFPIPEKIETVDYVFPNVPVRSVTSPYAQSVGRYGQLSIYAAGMSTGKSQIFATKQFQSTLYGISDTIAARVGLAKTKWLKPKHVTVLELKGHRVVHA